MLSSNEFAFTEDTDVDEDACERFYVSFVGDGLINISFFVDDETEITIPIHQEFDITPHGRKVEIWRGSSDVYSVCLTRYSGNNEDLFCGKFKNTYDDETASIYFLVDMKQKGQKLRESEFKNQNNYCYGWEDKGHGFSIGPNSSFNGGVIHFSFKDNDRKLMSFRLVEYKPRDTWFGDCKEFHLGVKMDVFKKDESIAFCGYLYDNDSNVWPTDGMDKSFLAFILK